MEEDETEFDGEGSDKSHQSSFEKQLSAISLGCSVQIRFSDVSTFKVKGFLNCSI